MTSCRVLISKAPYTTWFCNPNGGGLINILIHLQKRKVYFDRSAGPAGTSSEGSSEGNRALIRRRRPIACNIEMLNVFGMRV